MVSGYFPAGVLDPSPNSEELFDGWFSQHLHSAGEQPLFPAPDNQPLTFRFLALPTWGKPSTVRVEQRGERWWLVGRMTDGDGGYDPGPVIRTAEGWLSATEVQRLDRLFRALSFWELPTAINDTGCDGTTWVLEGAGTGRYHVAHRWCPDKGPFAAFCSFLGQLGGFCAW
ncbi:Uncharacterized protein OS=Chryseobacterium antarcticum GN=HY04_05025 PE=4 SV=1 [Gemmata massiliana]|uniref:Uncharacterized protein n=1 Tax=Gemmata massiliana TaxID=1210884 RepID=A0A6P2CWH1_9BACT|nr:hypothetical protein [Gemmata massiliana]VTR93331.1 Uncharacterized protein OS=Chryseobacterium antarcticum GN=HY04_05025 PE=4 SV=1 [Gemmata massiliana]